MANTIHVDVVSAEESIYSGDAEFVVLPGMMGELGIYPQHTPLLTQIKPGIVRIKVPGQAEEQIVFVQGGFLEVQPNVVTVLSDTAIRRAIWTRPRRSRRSARPRRPCRTGPRRQTSRGPRASLPAQWRNWPRSADCGDRAR